MAVGAVLRERSSTDISTFRPSSSERVALCLLVYADCEAERGVEVAEDPRENIMTSQHVGETPSVLEPAAQLKKWWPKTQPGNSRAGASSRAACAQVLFIFSELHTQLHDLLHTQLWPLDSLIWEEEEKPSNIPGGICWFSW